MSASTVLDLGNTTQMALSLGATNLSPSGQMCGLSGVQIGQSIYLGNANGFCNLWVAGYDAVSSGPLILQVQTTDQGTTTDTSGNYQDPTSGLAQLPTAFASGGLLYIGSGGTGALGPSVSGQNVQSGFLVSAAFQRPGLFARVNFLSGFYCGGVQAGFISALRTTGSGGGFSYQPLSGQVVNV